MSAFDFKKEYKDLYLPGTKPVLVQPPSVRMLVVDGRGDPNTSPAYAAAVEALYGICYTIKMSKMGGSQPEGYFDYVVPPLEGLWWGEDGYFDGARITDKGKFCWTMMIRQPDFVTPGVFAQAKDTLRAKKPQVDASLLRLEEFAEGLCAQVMHTGPYDDEPATVALLDAFIAAEGYRPDFSDTRHHHEIYLGDPRKTAPEKLKTVIRHPVAKA